MNRRVFIAAIGLLLSPGAALALPRPDRPQATMKKGNRK
jgi:hypothetical protein